MAIPVIVVGLGVRGRQWCHELRRSQHFTLAAACDPSLDARRHAVAAGLPPDRVFADLEQACIRVPARAAIVATPLDSHTTPCEQTIDAGLAVLVEKPFALSVSDARRLVTRAQMRDVPFLVGQNFRYLRMFRATKRLLDRGDLGPLAFVTMSYYREGHARGAGLDTLRGAALWETGIHHLDVLRHLLGDPVRRVSAHAATPSPSGPFRDTTWAITLEFERELLASYRLTWDSRGHAGFERGQQFTARFVGEHGTLHILQRWLVLCRRGRWPRVVRRGPRPQTEEACLLDQFAAAIAEGRPAEVSARDNLRTVALAEACMRSFEEGRSIDPEQLLES